MSNFLELLENEVQIIALLFLGFVYIFRIAWLLKFKSYTEGTYPAGNEKAGIVYSMMIVAMPWEMESTRKKPGFYTQFIIFHVGITIAISATFIIPYWPALFKIKIIVWIFQFIVGIAFIVGLVRLYRRITNPTMRLISTPDDFFSLILIIIYFAVSFFAIPNVYKTGELSLIIFFGLTAFLLIYVPFSKICHYLYYPFTRYFLGKTMGHRGVFPIKKH
jgi:nitrate reductase gamma subunit